MEDEGWRMKGGEEHDYCLDCLSGSRLLGTEYVDDTTNIQGYECARIVKCWSYLHNST